MSILKFGRLWRITAGTSRTGLRYKPSTCKFVICAISGGMMVISFPSKDSTLKFVSCAISGGMVVILFKYKDSIVPTVDARTTWPLAVSFGNTTSV